MRELRLALREGWTLLREAAQGMSRDRASTMGAALAYYTAFSLAPTLVIALAVAGLFFDDRQAEGALMDQLKALVGPNGAQAIQAMLRSAHYEGGSLISTAVSTAALVVGATTVFAELRRDLNRVWQAEDLAPKGVWATVRSRLLSFGLTLGIGFLLVVSLLMSAAVAAVTRFWGAWLGGAEAVLHLLDLATSFALVTLLFAMIYKLLPNRRIAWRDVWLGAAVTAFLFAAGKVLIGLYLGRSSLSSSFGAAGTFVVLLVWIYYSTQIFFFGAELTYAFAHRHGSRAMRGGRYAGPDRRSARGDRRVLAGGPALRP